MIQQFRSEMYTQENESIIHTQKLHVTVYKQHYLQWPQSENNPMFTGCRVDK